MKTLPTYLLLSAVLLGCADDPPPPPPPLTAPSLDRLEIPEWPPLGPDSTLTVTARDAQQLRSIYAWFEDRSERDAGGLVRTVDIHASDLGEGLGALDVGACNIHSLCTTQTFQRVLIDLHPPELVVERTVASPAMTDTAGQISFWVRDAWVLGSVELDFHGRALKHQFPAAYPETLGTKWDVSRVAFDASELTPGSDEAVVIVRDAAGNELRERITLTVDATPPVAAIVEPANGTTVGAKFLVRMSAADDIPRTATTIELWVGGARVAELPGPTAEIVIDRATLPPGPTELWAIARDSAGNLSAPAKVTVVAP
jgi:hypothetical protein